MGKQIKIQSFQTDSSVSNFFTKEDSTYKLSINIKPAPEGNLTDGKTALAIEYFLNIKSKDFVRIYTIIRTRIDTPKIKGTIFETSTTTFYNTFLFEAITTVLVIILILQFIP